MMIPRWSKVFLAAVLMAAAGAAKAASNEVSKVILFDPGVSAEQRVAAVERSGGKVVRQLALVDGVEAVFPAFQLASLKGPALAKGRSGIKAIELNEKRNWLVVAAPSFGAMPSIGDFLKRGAAPAPSVGPGTAKADAAADPRPWGVQRVGAQAAWGRTMGAGVRVAVLDTGIDATHPALKANYKGGFNSAAEGGDVKDGHGHGTHVAGTIAAGSKDIVGVAPQASLYAVKVLDDEGNGTYASIIKGLEWAVENRMQVVNMSLGGPASEALEAAVKKTLAAGVVIVAAAGTDPEAPVSAPALYDGVIAVSASAKDDSLAFFSTTGPEVDFIAPGHQVTSTWPGGGTNSISGTSMATPHVAGLAVLAVAMGHRGPAGVTAALQRASKPIAGLKPEQQGSGMIDAGALRPAAVNIAMR
ncbi:MAG: S8 family serine peptidase [Elusimicrobia bacterium]|nr:S8 family serine peptidase [Elusimicrobiota bacterium]